MTIHPAISILLLLMYASALPVLAPQPLYAVAVFVAAASLFSGAAGARRALRAMWRLRWLFLSILVVYFWFTPGTHLMGAEWLPTREGLSAGGHRLLILALMVFGIYFMLEKISRQSLVAGLVCLLTPLETLGLNTRRFSSRLVLTLDEVPRLQDRLRRNITAFREGGGRATERLGRAAALLVLQVEEDAERGPASETLPYLTAPAPAQWLLAVAAAGLWVLAVSW
ncbi:MAG: CbiQ family ECF transporter T component [Gammaproteobacteria bacterium]|jgi:energy-coupling factor transport system permease protein